jgi:hypothetical protein
MRRALALAVLAGGCFREPKPRANTDAAAGQPANNIAFVTSTTQPLPMGASALADADAICTDLAGNAGLQGTFVAWLSTSGMSAKSRLHNAANWVRRDGAMFVDTVANLTNGNILVPLDLDETGAPVTDDGVATATSADGSGPSTTYTCNDFSATSAQIRIGLTTATKGAWTDWSADSCDVPRRWYCFETDRVVPLAPPPDHRPARVPVHDDVHARRRDHAGRYRVQHRR